MRSLAPETNDLIPELVISASPGKRLAAICVLQQIPAPDYLNWLTERVAVEKPFLGYHATVALAAATRALGPASRTVLAQSVNWSKELLSQRKWQDPNQVSVLSGAEKELAELGPVEKGPNSLD